ncbi:MAG: HEAT repeat domain-containing protein [Bradymonadaceae bacterium]
MYINEMKTLLLRALFIALTLAIATPLAAQDAAKDTTAKNSAEAKETITLLLSDYHGVPTRASLLAVSPTARDILLDMARDEDLFSLYRHRALAALGHWPDAQVQSLMFGLLKSDETSEVLQHHLLGIVANAFGKDAVEVIAPYLAHEDVQLRLSAVGALSRIPHGDAEKVLQHAVSEEKNAVVRERLEDSLMRTR